MTVFSKVLFPEPFLPITEISFPFGREKEISFKTVLEWYPEVIFFNSITGVTSFALYQNKYKEGSAQERHNNAHGNFIGSNGGSCDGITQADEGGAE